jgi:hypothetical protein
MFINNVWKNGLKSSRCEIQNSLAMLEVCWDRHVVVHNQPDAIDSPEARCPTQPQVGDVTASQRAVHVVEAMDERQFAVRRDVQVAYLVGDGASICSEGFLPGSKFIVSADVSDHFAKSAARARMATPALTAELPPRTLPRSAFNERPPLPMAPTYPQSCPSGPPTMSALAKSAGYRFGE